MTATYFKHGAGKSLNARRAESYGKFPATTAAKVLGITTALLKEISSPCEWHHVGKFATKCDYFDTDPESFDFEACMTVLRTFRARLTEKRKAAREFWLHAAFLAMKREKDERAARLHVTARYAHYLSRGMTLRDARISARETKILDVAHKTAYTHACGELAYKARFVSGESRGFIKQNLSNETMKRVEKETIVFITSQYPQRPFFL
jgi:hypothetical protein